MISVLPSTSGLGTHERKVPVGTVFSNRNAKWNVKFLSLSPSIHKAISNCKNLRSSQVHPLRNTFLLHCWWEDSLKTFAKICTGEGATWHYLLIWDRNLCAGESHLNKANFKRRRVLHERKKLLPEASGHTSLVNNIPRRESAIETHKLTMYLCQWRGTHGLRRVIYLFIVKYNYYVMNVYVARGVTRHSDVTSDRWI